MQSTTREQSACVNEYVQLAGNFGVELNVKSVRSVCLDGIGEYDLASVDLDAVLCEKRFTDVLRCNGAVELAVSGSTRLNLDLYDDSFKFCSDVACCLTLKLDLSQASGFLVFEVV